MLTIKLPDGKNLKFSKEVTGLEIAEKISEIIDLRPASIETLLGLRAPIYSETAAYGHMGRKNQTVEKIFYNPNGEKKVMTVELFTWERLDLVPSIKVAFKL